MGRKHIAPGGAEPFVTQRMSCVRSKSKWNGWIILIDREITVYIQDQGRPKGHAPSVWPLRDGPFVSWPFRDR